MEELRMMLMTKASLKFMTDGVNNARMNVSAAARRTRRYMLYAFSSVRDRNLLSQRFRIFNARLTIQGDQIFVQMTIRFVELSQTVGGFLAKWPAQSLTTLIQQGQAADKWLPILELVKSWRLNLADDDQPGFHIQDDHVRVTKQAMLGGFWGRHWTKFISRVCSAKRRRLIDGAITLLDIVKESADAFPPLKSCLGAIDAFRKHYEQSKDVEDSLRDLIPWITKLENTVATASPDINPEESAGREQLTRSLERIWKRAQALSGKGKLARFLDKTRDSSTIVKLVEELRREILIYQLSQQQSIENQVSQLTKSPGVKAKIQSTLSWLGRLRVEDSATGDEGEKKQRNILFGTLEGIKDQLQSLSWRTSAADFQENDQDMRAACGLAEDIRDAVVEYQLHQQKAVYDQNCKLIITRLIAELLVLNTCRRAHGAGYQHGDRRGCLKGTRENVLDEIERWTENFDQSPIFWLHGLAGTGKTTIAQTIAERLFAGGRLGASFFCSSGSEDRSNLRLIFPTLAFQLAQRYPEFRSSLIPLLRSNPDIAYQSLQDQMKKLLVEPLRSADVQTVIVIDALDECKDDEPESAILPVLAESILGIPRVKLIITGRPELHIVTGFHGPLQGLTDIFILHEISPHTINQDICRFFEHELSKLARRRGGKEHWPTNEQLDWLCRRANGFFVYAVATVKVLGHHIEAPWDQLDTIMESSESTACEGEVRLKVYNSLDNLYLSILRTAFHDNKAKDDDVVRSVLSCVVLAKNPLSPSAIATLKGLSCHKVQRVLELSRSLLVLPSNPNETVRSFHKSFPDFMTDRTRCTDSRFYISPDCHSELFICCVITIGNSRKIMPFLPDYDLIDGPEKLPKIKREKICGALEYACNSWSEHLVVMEHPTPDVLSALLGLLEEETFVSWLAVLEALSILASSYRAMSRAREWLLKIQLLIPLDALLDIATNRELHVSTFGLWGPMDNGYADTWRRDKSRGSSLF
ncbi:hypothetical protein BJ322DRAFT_1019867 [Thelephora terrestris]|uniref:NACHT domain-containing protein n=1 Tax=Thelephora terrestris TaxID=56493 RepID=A0A9P6L8S0_9AGAM|nr:hypothetical protein BJ322DRAFT_1019867 [Thelephora terrestris]